MQLIYDEFNAYFVLGRIDLADKVLLAKKDEIQSMLDEDILAYVIGTICNAKKLKNREAFVVEARKVLSQRPSWSKELLEGIE